MNQMRGTQIRSGDPFSNTNEEEETEREALSLGHKALTADLEIRGKSSGDPCREGQINNRVTEAGNNDLTIIPSLF